MPHKHTYVSKKEISRRVDLINELSEMMQGQLAQEYRAVESIGATTNVQGQPQREEYVRGEDQEFDQTRDLDSRQLLQHQKNMIKE